jgi:hypothetical protein
MKKLHLKHYASEYISKRPACAFWRGLFCFVAWEKSININYHPVRARRPWINLPTTRFLSSRLRAGQSVFEFGAGGSTLFFLDKGLRVTTVEHDGKWFETISHIVSSHAQFSSWRRLLCEPTIRSTQAEPSDWANPDAYASSSSHHQNHDFSAYAKSIDRFNNDGFDLVLIDGRSRPSCVKHAACKVKQGGLLLVDNTERAHYVTSHTLAHLKKFDLVHDCYGPTAGLMNFTRSTIWQSRVAID